MDCILLRQKSHQKFSVIWTKNWCFQVGFGILIHVLSWRQQKQQLLFFHNWDFLTNFWRNNWRSIFDIVERLCSCLSFKIGFFRNHFFRLFEFVNNFTCCVSVDVVVVQWYITRRSTCFYFFPGYRLGRSLRSLYSCVKITKTWIQISRQNWSGLFSNISHQMMI